MHSSPLRRLFRSGRKFSLLFPMLLLALGVGGWAKEFPSGLEKKIKAIVIPHAESLARLPAVIAAVKKANSAPRKKMNNLRWKQLPVSSEEVQKYQNNAASKALHKAKAPYVAEIFVNAANGSKAAFLGKTTFWCHSSFPKHKIPMQGKVWVGELQLDESSGSNQIQVSVPVKDGEKTIGSLVLGAAVTKL